MAAATMFARLPQRTGSRCAREQQARAQYTRPYRRRQHQPAEAQSKPFNETVRIRLGCGELQHTVRMWHMAMLQLAGDFSDAALARLQKSSQILEQWRQRRQDGAGVLPVVREAAMNAKPLRRTKTQTWICAASHQPIQ